MGNVSAAWVLSRAANLSPRYDRNATSEVLLNLTQSFHLCGLIERAASSPRSGSTHRRRWDGALVEEAKRTFCLAHKAMHPAAWEFETKRTWQEVQSALLLASEAGQQ